MKSLADQLKGIGYIDKYEEERQRNKQKREQEQQLRKQKQLAEKQRKFKEREDRKKRLNAQPKDKIFKMAYTNNKDAEYTLTAYIDDISMDKHNNKITIYSMNCISITIDGKTYVMDHTHVRSDRVNADKTWKMDQKITFKAKIRRYNHGTQQKYELIND